MWKLFFICICIVLVLIGGFFAVYIHFVKTKGTEREKFSQSRYAPYAYEVLPSPSRAHEALSAFSYFEIQKKTLSDTVTEVKIRPHGHYAWKTFFLQRGYTLFLAIMPDAEGELNDTTTLDYLNYDIPILVDTNGYIVRP